MKPDGKTKKTITELAKTVMTEKINLDEIANILKVSPDALKAFEELYSNKVLALPGDTYFSVSKKQADQMKKMQDESKQDLSDIIDRIVNELLADTQVISFKDGELTSNRLDISVHEPVTLKELMTIPVSERPQLTGRYTTKDTKGEAYPLLLRTYKRFLEEKDPVKKKRGYHIFRQGLDIQDIDPVIYEILGMNPNSISKWFPALVCAVQQQHFFVLPETVIIKVPMTLLQLTRLEYQRLNLTTLNILDRYCYKVFGLNEEKEYFVKTGTFSSKFDFRNAHVFGAKEVRELGEYLMYIQNTACLMAGPLNKPIIYGMSTTNEWCVREYIKDKENNPCIYKGMPLHTEYRIFVDAELNEVIGYNPYWDPVIMKNRFSQELTDSHMKHDYVVFLNHEDVLMKRYHENIDRIVAEIKNMLPYLNLAGQWSIDIMQNGNDFYIIDMALAENSALYDCVPEDKRRITEENWIPTLSIEQLS